MTRGLAALFASCAIVAAHADLQVRDGSLTTAADASARLTGTILAVTGRAPSQPGRRAIVTLTGGVLTAARSVVSDDTGRFAFDRLPAGRFLLTASKPGYLPAAYGATRPGRPGVPIAIASGDRIDDVSITITHGAAVGGSVRDGQDAPVLGATVAAFRVLPDGTLASAGSAIADDRGAYRVFGLTAGDYVVSASLARATGLGEIVELSSDAIDRTLADLQARRRTPNAGAGTPPAGSTPAPPRASNFAPVFYPRAFSAADATPIPIGFGDERVGVDIIVERVSAAAVDGTLSGLPSASPLSIVIEQAGPVQQSILGAPILAARAPGNGAFTFTNVTPGHYTITAKASRLSPMLWARADVDVSGDDVGGIALTLQPALHVTGRIVFDATRLAPPTDLSTIRVMLVDASPRASGAPSAGRGADPSAPPMTDARGNFDVGDLTPGRYNMMTSLATDATGWWLRSAVVNGRDVLDAPLVIEAATPLAGVVLTFSDRHTELSGTLSTPAGRVASDYHIVIFPEDRSLWLPRARRIQSARPGTDGHFVLRDLPPGSYRLAALTDVAPDELLDPHFFEQLVGASIPVVLADGDRQTRDLKIGGV